MPSATKGVPVEVSKPPLIRPAWAPLAAARLASVAKTARGRKIKACMGKSILRGEV